MSKACILKQPSSPFRLLSPTRSSRSGSSWLAVVLVVALFCLVIFAATIVNSQQEQTKSPTTQQDLKKNQIVEEEIIESQLLKEKPVGTSGNVGNVEPVGSIPVLGEDEDDDFEDYDPDDFAVLGNEWLLKEIKEIEEQIQTVSSDEDVGDVVNRGPQATNASKSD